MSCYVCENHLNWIMDSIFTQGIHESRETVNVATSSHKRFQRQPVIRTSLWAGRSVGSYVVCIVMYWEGQFPAFPPAETT